MRSVSFLENSSCTFVVHQEAVRRCAGFPHVAHLGDHRAVDRRIDVGILEHDEGRIAAELHGRLDHVFRRLLQQLAADFRRAGKGKHPNARIVQHGAYHFAG